MNRSRRIAVWSMFTVAPFCIASGVAETPGYTPKTSGTRVLLAEQAGIEIKVLVEAANLGGGELEVGEITIPPNYHGSPHVHGIEVFYVLEGELIHIVNGQTYRLEPGMVGIVRSPDKVIHETGDSGARALVLWPGGGEVGPLAEVWTVRSIEDEE